MDAIECGPTFSASLDQVIGLMAGGSGAFNGAVEGAEDSESGGRLAVATLNVGPLDSVIGVAASGSTPYVKGLLREAAERGALTGSVTCAPNAPISGLAQHPIEIVTGPEVIMGSTRLKAGTAQKMALNMITTGVMVRVGRTFDNLMTDMRISNAKLSERAVVIVSEATGLPMAEARTLLERCNGEMKTAIVCALKGITPDEARRWLTDTKGSLNRIQETS
jgi:N-acetylmuramic acid 6-phosphate etherase